MRATLAWSLAQLAWKQGDHARAREHTAAARELYRRLDATHELEAIDVFFRGCGRKCQ